MNILRHPAHIVSLLACLGCPAAALAQSPVSGDTDQTLLVVAETQEFSKGGGSLRSVKLEYKYDFGDTTVLLTGSAGERKVNGQSTSAAGFGGTIYHDFSQDISTRTSAFVSANKPVFAHLDFAQDVTVRVADKTTLTVGGRWARYAGDDDVTFVSAGVRRYFSGGSISYRATWTKPDGRSAFVAHLVNLSLNDAHGKGKTMLWLGTGAASLDRGQLEDFSGSNYSGLIQRSQPIGGNLNLVLSAGLSSYDRPAGRMTGTNLGIGLLFDLDGHKK